MPQHLLASQSKRKGRRKVGSPTLRWLDNPKSTRDEVEEMEANYD
jgi:hypothetical protein